MTSQISLNPMATTNAAGLFNTNSAGYTQGDAQDDPAVRFALSGGVLSTAAVTPIWGGVPIEEIISSLQDGASPFSGNKQPGTDSLGSKILQAVDLATSTGICVFNQAFAGITTPQSTAPMYSPGMSVNFYRFGSGARIPLRINPALNLTGDIVNIQLSWDFVEGWLTTYDSTNAFPVKVLKVSTSGNKSVAYDGMTGNANWIYSEKLALCLI